MTAFDTCRFASSFGGVVAIVLAGIGFVVRMTPPMDGTAIYWWSAAAVAFAVGSGIGLLGLAVADGEKSTAEAKTAS